MNYKRALIFSILLYVISFAGFLSIQALFQAPQWGLREYIAFWIINIPITLFLAKWYFKMEPPTTKKGFKLGVVALVVGFFLDVVVIGIASATQSVDFSMMFGQFYTDWKFYLSILELLLLTTFAGFEFDATFSKRSS